MGFLEIIAWPFSYVFEVCYMIGRNYGVALLLFALFVKIILLPLSIKQQKNQIKSAKLRPYIRMIEKKYAGRTDRATLQKKQQEIMELQTQAGASPMAGCLPLLIQLPIIMGLYEIVRKPLQWFSRLGDEVIIKLNGIATGVEVQKASQVDQIGLVGKIKTLGPEAFSGIEGFDFNNLPNFNLFGLDLTVKPSFANPSWLLIIPLLVFVTSYFSMRLTRKLMGAAQPTQTREQAISMTIMDLAMPAFSTYLAFTFPAALGTYWVYQTVIGFAQSVILSFAMPLPKFTEEELKAIEKEMKKKKGAERTGFASDRVTCRDENKPVRSLHYIDEDDDDVPSVIKPSANKGKSSVGRANMKKK